MNDQAPDCVGICGAGQMGASSAVSFKRAGYRVLLWDTHAETLGAAEQKIQEKDRWVDEHVGPSSTEAGTIELAESLDALAGIADWVLDCIAEELDAKVELFTQCARTANSEAVFLTTTSGLSITTMAERSDCGRRLVGTHFWNPPHLMPLVEVVRGEETPAELIDRVCDLVSSIGKIPVRVHRDVPGFIGNRLLHALWREAIAVVEQGIASPEDVDQVARYTFGLRLPALGPLENMDIVGLNLIETIHKYLLADIADNHGPSELLSRNVANQELGVQSGKGFYDWSTRDPQEAIGRRDSQIVHQLEFLKRLENQ
jgi:3-hydroxybutyryl-CoA dehydrogenase